MKIKVPLCKIVMFIFGFYEIVVSVFFVGNNRKSVTFQINNKMHNCKANKPFILIRQKIVKMSCFYYSYNFLI